MSLTDILIILLVIIIIVIVVCVILNCSNFFGSIEDNRCSSLNLNFYSTGDNSVTLTTPNTFIRFVPAFYHVSSSKCWEYNEQKGELKYVGSSTKRVILSFNVLGHATVVGEQDNRVLFILSKNGVPLTGSKTVSYAHTFVTESAKNGSSTVHFNLDPNDVIDIKATYENNTVTNYNVEEFGLFFSEV